MSNILYSDREGDYSLLEYRRSHSELLIRKRWNQINIDIVFKSIQAIVIPTVFSGVEISLVDDKNAMATLKENYSFNLDYGYKIYCIKNNENKSFYLNGGVFGVFRNRLDILHSSLGDFMWSNENELLFWSEDVVPKL